MSRARTTAVFLVLAAIWGSSFPATRVALRSFGPVTLAAVRFSLAGLLMFGYAAVSTDRWRPRTRAEWAAVLVGGLLFVTAHHALWFAGQQYVSSAVAAVVISLDPVLAAAFSRALLPAERLTRAGVTGLVCGLSGTVVVANPGSELAGANERGVALVFGAATAFALGAVLVKRIDADLPAPTVQAWAMCVGAVALWLLASVLDEPAVEPGTLTPHALVALAYLIVVAAGVGYLLYFSLLDRLGPIEINLVGYVIPGFAALTGWILLGEPVTPTTIGGFSLVLVGFALVKHRTLAAVTFPLCEWLPSRRR